MFASKNFLAVNGVGCGVGAMRQPLRLSRLLFGAVHARESGLELVPGVDAHWLLPTRLEI